jgi:hypothetical protein
MNFDLKIERKFIAALLLSIGLALILIGLSKEFGLIK